MQFSFAKFFASRKLFVTLVAMVLVTAVAVASGWLPAIEGIYAIFVGAVTGIAGLYVTGNVGQKWVDKKNGGQHDPPSGEQSP